MVQPVGLKKIFKEHKVALAYLFGSRARGYARPDSDYDIAVVFSRKVTKLRNQQEVRELELALDACFHTDQVQVINLESVTSPLLKYEVVFRGELLFCTQPSIAYALSAKIMKEFEDTRHLREVQFQALKQRIQTGRFGKVNQAGGRI